MNLNEFNDKTYYSKIFKRKKYIFLPGDFNVDFLK